MKSKIRIISAAKKVIEAMQLRERANKIVRDPSLRYSLFVFLLTRMLVFAVFIVTTNLSVIQAYRDPHNGIPTYEAEIPLKKVQVARGLRQIAPHGDSGWYMGIAQGGYERIPFEATREHNWAFFPLFPLLLRLVSSATHEYLLTAMFMNTLLLLPALFFCHKTILALGIEASVANRTIFYLAIYPTSYFFSLPMTESLYLLLSAGSFWAAARDRWYLAGAVGALASATRNPGILLLLALLVLYYERYGFRFNWKLLGLMLVPTGLLSYMLFLHHITGNAFAAVEILRAWGRQPTLNVVSPLWQYLRGNVMLAQPWYLVGFHFAAGVLGLAGGIVLLKLRKWSLGIYVLFGVLQPLASGSLGSLTRYVMVLFPVFIPLAIAGRLEKIDQTIRAVLLVLLGLLSAMFAAHFSFAFT